MTITAHLKSLQNKHLELEVQITKESHHPLPNFAVITQLKKQKLVIKEQIESLLHQQKLASTA